MPEPATHRPVDPKVLAKLTDLIAGLKLERGASLTLNINGELVIIMHTRWYEEKLRQAYAAGIEAEFQAIAAGVQQTLRAKQTK